MFFFVWMACYDDYVGWFDYSRFEWYAYSIYYLYTMCDVV